MQNAPHAPARFPSFSLCHDSWLITQTVLNALYSSGCFRSSAESTGRQKALGFLGRLKGVLAGQGSDWVDAALMRLQKRRLTALYSRTWRLAWPLPQTTLCASSRDGELTGTKWKTGTYRDEAQI